MCKLTSIPALLTGWQAVVIRRFEVKLTCHKTVERFGDLKQRSLQYLHTFNPGAC